MGSCFLNLSSSASPFMFQEFKYAFRQLTRDKGFSAIVILTLGIGISGCILIFSLLNSVMWRPLPYANGDKQYQIRQYNLERGIDQWSGITGGDLHDIRERNLVFGDIAATRNFNHTVHWRGESEVVYAHLSTPNYFTQLGVTAALGTTITTDNAFVDNQPAAMLTWGLWQRLFEGIPRLLARSSLWNRVHVVSWVYCQLISGSLVLMMVLFSTKLSPGKKLGGRTARIAGFMLWQP